MLITSCSLQSIFMVFLVTSLMPVTSYVVYMHIDSLYMPEKYVAYICNFVFIFVSGTCMVDVVVGCILVHICSNVQSIRQYRMRAMLP